MAETVSYMAVTKYGRQIEPFATRERAMAWFRKNAEDWPECAVIEVRVLTTERRIARHKIGREQASTVTAFPNRLKVVGA